MHISFETLNGRTLTLSLDVEQFLLGPVMSHLAQMQNDCDPAEIIRDYLPPELDADDDEELMQAVEEACMLAVGVDHPHADTAVHYAVITDVVVEPTDLPYIRQHLLADEAPILQFPVHIYDPLPAA
jgi:hypothetical protein